MSKIEDLVFESHWLVLDSLVTEELDEEIGVVLEGLDEDWQDTTSIARKKPRTPGTGQTAAAKINAKRKPVGGSASVSGHPKFQPTVGPEVTKGSGFRTTLGPRVASKSPSEPAKKSQTKTPLRGHEKGVHSIMKGQHAAWQTGMQKAGQHEPLGAPEKKHLDSLKAASAHAHELSKQAKAATGKEKEELHQAASGAHRRVADRARNLQHHFKSKGLQHHASAFGHLSGYHANRSENHRVQTEAKQMYRQGYLGAWNDAVDANSHAHKMSQAAGYPHHSMHHELRVAHHKAMRAHQEAARQWDKMAEYTKKHFAHDPSFSAHAARTGEHHHRMAAFHNQARKDIPKKK